MNIFLSPLCASRETTHTGEEFMGIPATGQKIRFGVHGRGRFVDGKMAERWDRADFEDIKRQLT
jgi:predicted ester cyclase